MKQVLQNDRSRELQVVEVPDPRAFSGAVLVRNAVSLISAGTERMAVEFGQKSLLEKARSRPDLVKQVVGRVQKEGLRPTLEAVFNRLDQPVPLGYSCAGTVAEVGGGVGEFAVGQCVACAGAGYANHADIVVVPRNLVVSVPENVSLEDAAYVTLGAIALQGVRIADVRLGETVAVVGLGLLGQLSVQILGAAGCRVIGIDLDPAKVALARELGADAAVVRSEGVEGAVAELTDGHGVDAVVIAAATASDDPVQLAGQLCRDRGRVSLVGAVGMTIPRETYYRKELTLQISRSYGPGRYDPEYEEKGRDYPVGYVRWTERRNMSEFLRLVAEGHVTPARLTTHRFPVEQAADAYDLVTGKRAEEFLGILLTYDAVESEPRRVVRLRPTAAGRDRVAIGLIGAGSFGKTVLLPRLAHNREVRLVGIATATGSSGHATASKFGLEYCTTEAARVLEDDSIDAAVIMTRHGSHARYVVQALAAGKAVFVEKPLALTEAELVEIVEAQAASGQVVAVGFNRRFAPTAQALRAAFADAGPLAIHYRVNAGPIPATHWIHDPDDGGGRIIGEVCHFVDFVQFVAGAAVEEVFAAVLGGAQGATHDTLSVVLRLSDGSVASIGYFATGDKAFPKERVEVFGGGATAVLDDFRRLTVSRGGKRVESGSKVQDKGFDAEIAAVVASFRTGEPAIPLESLVRTTRATFAIEESIRTGMPVRIP